MTNLAFQWESSGRRFVLVVFVGVRITTNANLYPLLLCCTLECVLPLSGTSKKVSPLDSYRYIF